MEDSLAGLSNDAKVLYALMLDRASISKVNGFLETDGTIRIYFTVEQAQKKLHRSRQCATRIFHELEFSGLICRKKQGLGKPALITLNYPANAKLIQPKEDSSRSKTGHFSLHNRRENTGEYLSLTALPKWAYAHYRSDKGGTM